jgi:CBS domain-containing protein
METVADVMLRSPKTLPGAATVGEVRALLDNPNVQMVLLADGDRFRGAITALPAAADPEAAAVDFADLQPPSIAVTASSDDAFAAAAAHPNRRLVVLDDEGALLGLVCLNADRTHFCGGATR